GPTISCTRAGNRVSPAATCAACATRGTIGHSGGGVCILVDHARPYVIPAYGRGLHASRPWFGMPRGQTEGTRAYEKAHHSRHRLVRTRRSARPRRLLVGRSGAAAAGD